MKFLRFLLNSISVVLILIAAAVLLGLQNKLPSQFRLFTVITGSMEPTIPVGSVVISQPASSVSALKKGDVIIFEQPGQPDRMITHRIHDIVTSQSSPSFITKGDANTIPDSWRVSYGQIKGVEKYHYPHIGSFIEFLRTPIGIALFVGIPILILAVSEIRNIVNIMVESRLKTILEKSKKHIQLGIILMLLVMTIDQSYALLISNTVSIGPNSLTTAANFPDRLVINEIFFWPDATHGNDCNTVGSSTPPDVTINQSNTNTGPGSTNTNTATVNNSSTSTQTNNATINETIGATATTGGNTTSGNTSVGDVSSGNISLNLQTSNSANSSASCDEWIELYNPNAFAVPLNNWQITDSSGTTRTLNTAASIPAQGFALLVKNTDTFTTFWTAPVGTPIISLNQMLGNGLGNSGDHLVLQDPNDVTIDTISWGTDPLVPHYAGPLVQGESLARNPSGADTNSGTDFASQQPTPGQ